MEAKLVLAKMKEYKNSKSKIVKNETFNLNRESSIIIEWGNEDANSSLDSENENSENYHILLTTVSKRKSSSKPKHSSFSQRSIEEKKINDEKRQIGIEDPYIDDPTDYDEFFSGNVTRIKSKTEYEKVESALIAETDEDMEESNTDYIDEKESQEEQSNI